MSTKVRIASVGLSFLECGMIGIFVLFNASIQLLFIVPNLSVLSSCIFGQKHIEKLPAGVHVCSIDDHETAKIELDTMIFF